MNKNIENFVWFPKQYLLGFFIVENQLANISDRSFLFLHNTLLLNSFLSFFSSINQHPYKHDCFSKISRSFCGSRINLYVKRFQYSICIRSIWTKTNTEISFSFWLTLFYTDGRRNEYTRFAWAGGTFFPVVLLFQFFVLARNWFWFYIQLMYLEYRTVVVLC